MASTTAMFTGLTGLTAHARQLDVIGNNIANVNTTAFKSNRMMFSSAFSRTFSLGSAPTADTGGTNPGQIGQGVNIAGTQRDFRTGAINATGDARDLAIEGKGFFVVERNGAQLYTRDGSFRQNASQDLVGIDGVHVKGYAVDDQFNIIDGALVNLNIPVGSMTIAEATRNTHLSGNLNADGDLPTHGSRTRLGATETDGFGVISTATVPPDAGHVLETTSLLTEIEDPLLPGTDTPLFGEGQIIQITEAEKGTKALPSAQLALTTATTIADLIAFFNDALGIHTDAGANPDGATPGLTLDPVTGVLTLNGNTGTTNNIALDNTDVRLLTSDQTFVRYPFDIATQAESDGEAVRTTFIVYDSLGTPVEVDLTMALNAKDETGTSWRYYVDSADDSDMALQVGTGLVSFDTSGQLANPESVSVSIDRVGTGAATPLVFSMAFTSDSDNVTALTDTESSIASTFQDGSPIGTLSGFAVGSDGLISGAFTNGLTRTIGQVAVATFTNIEGLVDRGNNVYGVGPNSGTAVVTTAGRFGTGRIVGGALEQSNVDLSAEFIKMIMTSTGFSASSRVIRTTDELMQQLLVLGR